jgi:hypothetical protein
VLEGISKMLSHISETSRAMQNQFCASWEYLFLHFSIRSFKRRKPLYCLSNNLPFYYSDKQVSNTGSCEPQVLAFHDFSGKLSEILKIYVSSLN